jgi:hypothetical protein
LLNLPTTLRGFQDFNLFNETKASKQLDGFLNHKYMRCEKPLLACKPQFYQVIGVCQSNPYLKTPQEVSHALLLAISW